MSKWNLTCALLVLATVTAKYSVGCKRTGSALGSNPNTRDADTDIYACGICGQPITVTLIVTNYFVEPIFNIHITVNNKPQRELIYFLEAASVQNPQFRFTAEHYGTLGYMITKINGVAASVSNKTYWEILEHPSGNSLQLGASTYVPLDDETIQFNFTTWDDTDS